MPKIRVRIELTTNELKSLLPKSLQELWTQLTCVLVDLGHTEKEANLIVAQMFLKCLVKRDNK
jgi:hypothetical protein